MSKPKKRVPEIRFKDFTNDWEQRKLKDVAEFNPKSELPNQFEYVDLESVIGTELTSHRTETLSSAPSRAQRLAKKGDIFYQTVRPYQKNNYLFDLPYDNYVFSTGYAQIRPSIYNYFLFYRLQEERFVSNVLRWSTGTSYPAISSNDLAQIKVNITLEHKEQILIGNFFKGLDNTITLHQRKLDKLKQLKKAYMQVMFPLKEESVPKLRFADFNEEWEQRKVQDISKKTFGGGTPKTSEVEYWDGSTPWIQSSDLNEHQVLKVNVNKKITDLGFENSASKRIPGNSITIVTRVGVGKIALVPFEYSTSQDFLSLSKLKVDSLFGVYSLYQILQREAHIVQGTSIKGITKKELLNKKVNVPMKLKEQIRLGSFFKELDSTIALHQSKLDKLQKLKKGYLQKLFC